VIENWVSWDYGPGKTHHNPPFLFALINFAVFLFILSRLFGKSFKTFLENRHGEVRHALDRARHVQKEAEDQLKGIESRIAGLEAEMNELLASYRKQAEAERKAIVKRAEEEAAGLLRDAEAQAQAAIATARRQLEEKAALLAIDLAEKLVRSRLREEDHKRLTEQYVAQVESLSLPKESV
jgi:F-type H+-transporting ATPase subunit b